MARNIHSIIVLALLFVTAPLLRALPDTHSDYFTYVRPMIEKAAINERLAAVGAQLNADYADKEVVFVMIMKGALCLVSDLMQLLEVPFTLEYVRASSYGQNGMHAGKLTVHGLEDLDLTDKHVILIDDIFDTGKTLTTVARQIQEKNPASLKTLVLLVKNIERSIRYRPDYVMFDIDNHFVIGYGLDYKDHYRGLPGIYVLTQIPDCLS